MGSRLHPIRFADGTHSSSLHPDIGDGRLPPYAGDEGAGGTPDGSAEGRRWFYEGV